MVLLKLLRRSHALVVFVNAPVYDSTHVSTKKTSNSTPSHAASTQNVPSPGMSLDNPESKSLHDIPDFNMVLGDPYVF